jgi:transcriptional regulator with XRE-family HTH domain
LYWKTFLLSSISSQTPFPVEKAQEIMYYARMENKNRAFLARLNALLDARDWTNAELSRQSGVSESMLTNYAKGTRAPSPATIAKLAKALEVSADYLMLLTDDSGPPRRDALPEYALEVLDSMRKLSNARRYELMIIAKSFVSASDKIEKIAIEDFISIAVDLSDQLSGTGATDQLVKFLALLQIQKDKSGKAALVGGSTFQQNREPD